MATPQRALGDGTVIDMSAVVDDDAREAELEVLRLEIRSLKRAVSDADLRADRAREDADRALGTLRRQLSPLYRALQAVFGELDAAGVTDTAPASAAAAPSVDAPDARTKAVWESWKSRLSPACGKVIDALLLHGELNSVQIKVAARLGTSTVSDSISKLYKAGLINKNGGRFSLKTL